MTIFCLFPLLIFPTGVTPTFGDRRPPKAGFSRDDGARNVLMVILEQARSHIGKMNRMPELHDAKAHITPYKDHRS